mmetsp:Transcript_22231/g.34838  ORF Transcript_22231/g.34838 Transcript_22231/m.34838 type:complete len:223 (-) Transcript_22231:102-770(-)|eukprot:CAMPEP_0184313868 /NCGR_PEP_ID=MMETSP1049-20130417/68559_1 /TAXON_ID=77928 /ORGANISM="Proteomonas sulcata, Strain CCMP704" /LENGTH=222 /DNA_ID=CAMNT_0026631445 /DNA_START=50 /DNA_END=718 /DNA_ORIENTATION=-
MAHPVHRGLLGAGAIIALAFTVACLIVFNATPLQQKGAVELFGMMQPVYYPEPELVYSHPATRATMLSDAEEDGTADDDEEAAQGRALSEIAEGDDREVEDYWPFPDQFQPVKAATYDDYGRVLHSAKCEINPWTSPDEYLSSDHGNFGFPQSLNCAHGPAGVPGDSNGGSKSNNWTYKCYSNGKCALVQADAGEDAVLPASDGIAKDDQWAPMPVDAQGGR